MTPRMGIRLRVGGGRPQKNRAGKKRGEGLCNRPEKLKSQSLVFRPYFEVSLVEGQTVR